MKTLLGILFEEFVFKIGENPEKHFYSPKSETEFSIFLDGNEFLFAEGRLFSVKISNFYSANKILGFEFPVETKLEILLTTLEQSDFNWEVFQKYSLEHWVVIKLQKHELLYEFEFIKNEFKLQNIRLEGGLAAFD